MSKTLTYPFTLSQVAALRAGDRVRVSGRVFTARDRVHKHLFDGGAVPVDLKDGALYHCGPVVVRTDAGWKVHAAGPTTSLREERFMPRLLEQHRVRVIIGKGGMGEATRRACAQFGCVYLHAVGGAACLLAERIVKVNEVHLLREFGPTEAIWELTLQDFEAVVTMDTRGRSLHEGIRRRSRAALRRALQAGPPAR